MTVSERQRRFIAKRAAKLAPPKPPPAPLAAPPSAPADSGVVVRVEHLRLYADRTAPWLRQRLGRSATLALIDALSKALATRSPRDSEDADR